MINSIIDLDGNRSMIEDMATVKAAGVTAMIHKATLGVSWVDQGYAHRRAGALANGMLWGAYHFITHDDPIVQANHFADTVQPDAETLIAVDLEHNTDGNIPTLAQVEAYIQQIDNRLGRLPVLYTGFYVLKDDLGWTGEGAITSCALWLAAYGADPFIPKGWTNYTLWQYTNGSIGPEPHRFPGLQNAYDREQFNGTADELNQWWGS